MSHYSHVKILRRVMKFADSLRAHFNTQPVRPRGPSTMLRACFRSHVDAVRLSEHSGVQLVPFNITKVKRVDGPEFIKNGGFASGLLQKKKKDSSPISGRPDFF